MAGFEAAPVWLLEVVGKKKIGDLLAPTAQRQLRIVSRALEDAQRDHDELADVARLLATAHADRDRLEIEVSQLRVEIARLNAELAAERAVATPAPPSTPSATARTGS